MSDFNTGVYIIGLSPSPHFNKHACICKLSTHVNGNVDRKLCYTVCMAGLKGLWALGKQECQANKQMTKGPPTGISSD